MRVVVVGHVRGSPSQSHPPHCTAHPGRTLCRGARRSLVGHAAPVLGWLAARWSRVCAGCRGPPGCHGRPGDVLRFARFSSGLLGGVVRRAHRHTDAPAGFAEARVAELSSPAHGPGPPSLREAEAARAQLQAEGWTTVPSWQDLLEGARPQHNDQAVGLGDWPHGWQFHASRIRHSHFRDRVLLPSLPPSLRALLRSQAGAQAGAWLTAIPADVPCRLRCCGSRCPSLPTDAGVRGPAAEASLTLSGIMPLLARGLVCSLGARRLSSGPGCGSRAKLWAQKVRWCRSSGSRPLESTRGTDAAWTWSSTVFPRGGRHTAATPRLCRR